RPHRLVQPGPHRAGRQPRGALPPARDALHRAVPRRLERLRARRGSGWRTRGLGGPRVGRRSRHHRDASRRAAPGGGRGATRGHRDRDRGCRAAGGCELGRRARGRPRIHGRVPHRHARLRRGRRDRPRADRRLRRVGRDRRRGDCALAPRAPAPRRCMRRRGRPRWAAIPTAGTPSNIRSRGCQLQRTRTPESGDRRTLDPEEQTTMSRITFRTRAGRRAVVSGVGLVAAVGLLAGCAGTPAPAGSGGADDPVTITYVGYGGAGQDAQIQAWQVPYTQAHPNVTFVNTSPPDVAQVKAQVEAGAVQWDVIATAPYAAEQNCDTLFEPLDIELTVPEEDLIPGSVGKCYTANWINATPMAYRTDAFPNGGPKTVEDFFDVDKFPGQRGFVTNLQNGI